MGVWFKGVVGDGELGGVWLGMGLAVGVLFFVGVAEGVFVDDGVTVGVCGVADGVFVRFGDCDTIRDTSVELSELVSLVVFGVTGAFGFKLLSLASAMFAG